MVGGGLWSGSLQTADRGQPAGTASASPSSTKASFSLIPWSRCRHRRRGDPPHRLPAARLLAPATASAFSATSCAASTRRSACQRLHNGLACPTTGPGHRRWLVHQLLRHSRREDNLPFKTVMDAIRLRAHVVEMWELADQAQDENAAGSCLRRRRRRYAPGSRCAAARTCSAPRWRSFTRNIPSVFGLGAAGGSGRAYCCQTSTRSTAEWRTGVSIVLNRKVVGWSKAISCSTTAQ